MGVLFATGLLILYPQAGWAVLVGVSCRLAYARFRGAAAQGEMEVLAGGVIAGDALTGFYKGVAAKLDMDGKVALEEHFSWDVHGSLRQN